MAIKHPDMNVKIGNIKMKSPVMTTSGTSGSSNELLPLDKSGTLLSSLGAFVTKGVTLKPRLGNDPPRVVETRSGILNSIGLQNNGAEVFVKKELPQLLVYELPIIVNISADSVEGFGDLAAFLTDNDVNQLIDGIEINVSCPNIKEGGIAFGTNPHSVEEIVRVVKARVRSSMTIITKLTPNITDITRPARAAIEGGTDALSMINTLRGMAINIEEGAPFLKNKSGGLSGPAIKPVGVYMVYECFNKINECRKKEIPIIGIGGITNHRDALEYIMAGATAVGIGTEWFVHTGVFEETYKGIENFIKEKSKNISAFTGIAHK
jgi:dihydroorotate dehydrogenase (NAD+) catalytic subunit